jgi:hypothetical protein
MRAVALAVGVALLAGGCAVPAPPCLLAGQQRMQVIDLFFGRDIAGRGPVTDAEWDDFAARVLTPRFPDGFTVFDAHGQWLNPQTGTIGREASRMVRVAVPLGADVSARVEAVSDAYKVRFRQVAVGVVSSVACARF